MINKNQKSISWRTIIVLIIAIVILLLLAAYIFVIHPIIGTPFVPLTIYTGLSSFTPETYGELEKGDLFVDTFYSYDFAQQCEVTDFYYIDNKRKDSFIYGKRPDVYALTLDAGVNYGIITEYIRNNGTHCGTEIEGYNTVSYYYMSTSDQPSDRFVFRVGNDSEVLQFILVTEISDKDLIEQTSGGDYTNIQIIMETIFSWSSYELTRG